MTLAINFLLVTTAPVIIYCRCQRHPDETAGLYQLAYISKGTLNKKNHYMVVNSNPAASKLNKKNFLSQEFSQLSPVLLTPVIKLYFRISPRIYVKLRKGPNWILRGPEETNSSKNLKSSPELSRNSQTNTYIFVSFSSWTWKCIFGLIVRNPNYSTVWWPGKPTIKANCIV